ncbi:MerR family transcriptional regulator [Bacillus toyonensis]|uniref:MerR family transcriptional regulator n=1 Tax=Bacillus toyonensis TaxID=155322 RepID=UPI000BFE7D93|nr:MerR family transcriptional regulator [Bacillus toyonensis]PHE23612.1 transcriptional regulator [Bacillus toyonensis]
METNQEIKEYKMKEVAEITGLSNDLLRTYEEEFNLQIARTSGGHRRYTEEDINTFVTIKKKIQEQNWSYKKIRAWLNGEEMSVQIQEQQVVSNLERKLDQQTELIQDLSEKLEKSMMLQVEMVKQMQELKQEKKQLEQIVENRNQDLINTLIEEKRKDREERQEKKPFLQRLFGK